MDRTSCILFGDGCGAAIVGRTDAKDTSGILSTMIASDASGKEFFELIPGGSIQPITAEIIEKRQNFMMMQGREMFKVAVKTLADNATKAIAKAGLTKEQVDWLVPHQANARIIEATAARLEIPMEKVITNIENLGNTSAATVPIAFHQAIEEGKIKRGDIIVFDVFGAGLTSGAIVFRY
jgi:3-oxoacyl-[acyl-carrier-protein] synthase-3